MGGLSGLHSWHYYNHAAVPSTAPHETPDLSPLTDGSIWNVNGQKPLLASWTTDWDCGWDTGWWYVIKDTPFDISALNTKRRYEITKGMRFFDVREINPLDYVDAIFLVLDEAFSAYPAKYRPVLKKEAFLKDAENWSALIQARKMRFFGAFFKESNELCGYSFISLSEKCIGFDVQKTRPKFEKYNVNAALVYKVLDSIANEIACGRYFFDGSRAINHETRFQDYLEKYFGFRKAYCKLNVAYPSHVKFAVKFLYPLRRAFSLLGKVNGKFHMLSSVLKMEEIARKGRGLDA